MNGEFLEQLFRSAISEYFSAGGKLLTKIPNEEVMALAIAINQARKTGGTVYISGNGGSASTASHFATDIGIGSLNRANPVRSISLCDNTSAITAIANDMDYSSIFAQQLKLLGKQGDLLIVISASGNSDNLIKAVEIASELGMASHSLTGFDGGKLKQLTLGRNIHVETPKGAYGLVEDAHLAICHVITECIRLVK
jgi:D-sedoheptulose 7-phosphate isomerase